MKNITILDGGRRIETRTRLVRIEFAVAYDTSLGIRLMQHSKHLVQDDHLLGGAVVLVLVLGTARMASFVAYSNALCVEALHVASLRLDRSAIVQASIPPHVEVIPRTGAEAACPMAGHQLLDGEVLVGTGVRAVQHQQANLPG